MGDGRADTLGSTFCRRQRGSPARGRRSGPRPVDHHAFLRRRTTRGTAGCHARPHPAGTRRSVIRVPDATQLLGVFVRLGLLSRLVPCDPGPIESAVQRANLTLCGTELCGTIYTKVAAASTIRSADTARQAVPPPPVFATTSLGKQGGGRKNGRWVGRSPRECPSGRRVSGVRRTSRGHPHPASRSPSCGRYRGPRPDRTAPRPPRAASALRRVGCGHPFRRRLGDS